MVSDNSNNPNFAVNSDSTVDSSNLFNDGQPDTALPKQQRVSIKQRKLDIEEYKSAYLTPMKIADRHSLNISNATWQLLERFSRILGERGSSVGCYAERIIKAHFDAYESDLEAWRKL